jgi:hypothetical protein
MGISGSRSSFLRGLDSSFRIGLEGKEEGPVERRGAVRPGFTVRLRRSAGLPMLQVPPTV